MAHLAQRAPRQGQGGAQRDRVRGREYRRFQSIGGGPAPGAVVGVQEAQDSGGGDERSGRGGFSTPAASDPAFEIQATASARFDFVVGTRGLTCVARGEALSGGEPTPGAEIGRPRGGAVKESAGARGHQKIVSYYGDMDDIQDGGMFATVSTFGLPGGIPRGFRMSVVRARSSYLRSRPDDRVDRKNCVPGGTGPPGEGTTGEGGNRRCVSRCCCRKREGSARRR